MGLTIRRISMATILFALAGILSFRTATGQMALYIHPRYELLVYACALVVFLFGAVSLSSHATPPAFGTMFLLVPVCLAIGITPKPLGSAALVGQFHTLNAVAPSTQTINPTDTTTDRAQWDLYDWAIASSVDITPYAGSTATVEGFVVQNPELGLPADQLMLARYVLKCCTADAGGVGMPVVWANPSQYAADTWVRVTGTITVESRTGVPRALLVATSVVPIEPPMRPYLLP